MTYTFDGDIVSDLHKDAYGFRPSEGWWKVWGAASDDKRQSIWDDLLVALDQALAEETAAYDRAEQEFKESIATNISLGAPDRATAIRWIVDSLELTENDKMYGAEYVCYRLGLRYSMQKQFEGLV